MQYYSTNHKSCNVSLREALLQSTAGDGGLYMPQQVKQLPSAFFKNIKEMTTSEISYFVSNSLFGEEIKSEILKYIGDSALSFSMPLVQIEPGIYAMELFHGPTMSVKDIGARYLARLHGRISSKFSQTINVLVASNGNSGSAIANGFHMVDGVNVFALYPQDIPAQSAASINDLGKNVHALKVNGSIDDCRRMVTSVLTDKKLNENIHFTSANTLNIGRVLPQSIAFFLAYAQLLRQMPKAKDITVSVPTGNAGNLLAGYIAKIMGLPIGPLVAACNANGCFAHYLATGNTEPMAKSVRTLAYAMDTCQAANIERFRELCHGDVKLLANDIVGAVCSDDDIRHTITDVYSRTGYVLDPHSAVAYKALKDAKSPDSIGIVMATAHPAKSAELIQQLTGKKIEHPNAQKRFNHGSTFEMKIHPTYPALKKYILQTQIV